MKNDKPRVAVIGVGNMGKHHARNYFEMPSVKLVAICDIDVEKNILAKKFKCAFYTDYKKLLKNESIDAISLVVPTKIHEKIAIDICKAKKHLLVEKPIASTIKGAKRIIHESVKANIYLTVGHIERFNPAVLEINRLIKEGKFGKVISITANRVGPFAPRKKDTGVILDLAVHDIDIINYLLKKIPSSIHANAGMAINKKIEDYADIFLNYGTSSGFIQVNWITPFVVRGLHVTGTQGYANVNYITQEIDFYKSKYKQEFDDYGDFVIKFGKSVKNHIQVVKAEPLRQELDSFISRAISKRKPLVTGKEALQALEVALKAQKICKL